MSLGLANDSTATWHPHFSNYPPAFPSTQDIHSHPSVGTTRQIAEGRRVAVWRACYRSCCHNRYGKHHWCCYGGGIRRSWSCVLVLVDGRFRHFYKIFRGVARYKIPCEIGKRNDAGRSDVYSGTRFGLAQDGISLCLVHSNSSIRHRMHGASQCHFDHNACFVWHQHGVEWQHTDVAYGCCAHRRCSKHIKSVQYAGSVYGIAVCVGMRLHIVWQCLLHRAGDKTDSAFGILAGSSRRRICGRFGHDGSPLRHSARSVQQ